MVRSFRKDTTANFKYIVHSNCHRLWFNFCLRRDVLWISIKQFKARCQLDENNTTPSSPVSKMIIPINDESLLFDQVAFSNDDGSSLCNDTSLWVDYSPGTWDDNISSGSLGSANHSPARFQILSAYLSWHRPLFHSRHKPRHRQLSSRWNKVKQK